MSYGTANDNPALSYSGMDAFGRIISQKWTRANGEVLDSYTYAYDGGSNRLYRQNALEPQLGELYQPNGALPGQAYDGLNRLTAWQRGELTDGNGDGVADSIVGTASRRQEWGLDALGNWAGFQHDGNGDGTWEVDQTRTANAANEIAGISAAQGTAAWAAPQYDAAGNMVELPNPANATLALGATYDAWNRLVRVAASAPGLTEVEYQYDGLNRRIVRIERTGSEQWTRDDDYYDGSWRVVEERQATDVPTSQRGQVATTPTVQYVWDLRYVDSPVVRLRDANGDAGMPEGDGLEETVYYLTDANGNVTGLVLMEPGLAQGLVVERYVYDAYGQPQFLQADWTVATAQQSAYGNEVLYAGYRYDGATGLYQARNRWYHPTLGVWTSRDPIGYGDGMDLYGYCGQGPTGATDPKGLVGELVGHHKVCQCLWQGQVSDAVAAVFDAPEARIYSEFFNIHRNVRYGGIEHSMYVDEVSRELEGFLQEKGVRRMRDLTAEHARELLGRIDAAPKGSVIGRFNAGVRAKLQACEMHAAELIEQQMKPGGFLAESDAVKRFVAAAKARGAAGGATLTAEEAARVEARTSRWIAAAAAEKGAGLVVRLAKYAPVAGAAFVLFSGEDPMSLAGTPASPCYAATVPWWYEDANLAGMVIQASIRKVTTTGRAPELWVGQVALFLDPWADRIVDCQEDRSVILPMTLADARALQGRVVSVEVVGAGGWFRYRQVRETRWVVDYLDPGFDAREAYLGVIQAQRRFEARYNAVKSAEGRRGAGR